MKAVLPLDPPLQSSKSWDALADSLWEGLSNLAPGPVAIVWSGAADLAAGAPVDYDLAVAVLEDVATSLGDVHRTDGDSRVVSVFNA